MDVALHEVAQVPCTALGYQLARCRARWAVGVEVMCLGRKVRSNGNALILSLLGQFLSYLVGMRHLLIASLASVGVHGGIRTSPTFHADIAPIIYQGTGATAPVKLGPCHSRLAEVSEYSSFISM